LKFYNQAPSKRDMKHEEPESYEILNAVEINEGKKVTRTRKRKKNTANDNLNVNFQV